MKWLVRQRGDGPPRLFHFCGYLEISTFNKSQNGLTLKQANNQLDFRRTDLDARSQENASRGCGEVDKVYHLLGQDSIPETPQGPPTFHTVRSRRDSEVTVSNPFILQMRKRKPQEDG